MTEPGVHLWLEDHHAGEVGLRIRLRACLHAVTSPVQRIEVFDSAAFGRILVLAGAIALTERDEAVYAEGLAHVAAATHPAPRRALVLGGGDGGVVRELLRHPGIETIDAVEIDEQVIAACREHLPWTGAALDDDRVTVTVDDAHRFLAGRGPTWDLVVVDSPALHDPAGTAVHARSLPQLIRSRLAEGGVVTAPLGSPHFEPDGCRNAAEELAEAVGPAAVYALQLPSQAGGTLLCIRAGAGDPTAVVGTAPGGLESWSPEGHAALFRLPGGMARAVVPG